MARILQDLYSYSVKMAKAFLVRGQIKDEVEENFHTTAEPIMKGRIFKSVGNAVYSFSRYCYCLVLNNFSVMRIMHAISLQLRAFSTSVAQFFIYAQLLTLK